MGLVFVAEMELYDNKKSYCVIVNKNIIVNMKLSIPLKFSYLRIVSETVSRVFLFGLYRDRHFLRSDCAIELVSSTGHVNDVLQVPVPLCRLEREV